MKRLLVLVLLLGLHGVTWAAPSAQYVELGTPKLFADSAQAEDVTITLSALAAGAGRYSARYDKGSVTQPATWIWECHFQLTGTNVVGTTIEIYVILSDGTNVQGNLGTTDAALVTDKRRNLNLVGLLVVDQTTTNTTMAAHGIAYIPTRYFSLGVWNATALPLTTSTSVHGCTFTPAFIEMQ